MPCTVSNLKVKKFGKRNQTKATQILRIAYTNVCGPFVPTVNGECYYITFTEVFCDI